MSSAAANICTIWKSRSFCRSCPPTIAGRTTRAVCARLWRALPNSSSATSQLPSEKTATSPTPPPSSCAPPLGCQRVLVGHAQRPLLQRRGVRSVSLLDAVRRKLRPYRDAGFGRCQTNTDWQAAIFLHSPQNATRNRVTHNRRRLL